MSGPGDSRPQGGSAAARLHLRRRLVALAAIAAGVALAWVLLAGSPTYEVHAVFDRVNGLDVGSLDEAVDAVEDGVHLIGRAAGEQHPCQRDAGRDGGERDEAPAAVQARRGGAPLRSAVPPAAHPNGILGLAPQNSIVPTVEIRVTAMMLTAIARAVATPTSLGPPRTL